MNSINSIFERDIEAILSEQLYPDSSVLRDIAQDSSISLQQRYLAASVWRLLTDLRNRKLELNQDKNVSNNPLLDIPSILINNPLLDEVTENIAAYRRELDRDLEDDSPSSKISDAIA